MIDCPEATAARRLAEEVIMQAVEDYRMLVDFGAIQNGQIVQEAFIGGVFLHSQKMATHYFSYNTINEVADLLEFFNGKACGYWIEFGELRHLVSSGSIREKLYKYEITHQEKQSEQVNTETH